MTWTATLAWTTFVRSRWWSHGRAMEATGNPVRTATGARSWFGSTTDMWAASSMVMPSPKPIIIVDEVTQTAVTMPGGEAAPGTDSPIAEQQARRDAAIVYKDLRLVIGEQRNRGQGHGLSDGASCWLSASTSVPELLLLRDCSVSPEKLQKCNRGGRRGTDTELQCHS